MNLREAQVRDIEQLSAIRLAVKENVLSNPALITSEDYKEYLTKKGKGWVAEVEGQIVGFAIADLVDHNIWALFVHPAHEGQGIGRGLHQSMLDWYFSQTRQSVWLSTAPDSRAASFYKKAGWIAAGTYGEGELKFEMSYEDWQKASTISRRQ